MKDGAMLEPFHLETLWLPDHDGRLSFILPPSSFILCLR